MACSCNFRLLLGLKRYAVDPVLNHCQCRPKVRITEKGQ